MKKGEHKSGENTEANTEEDQNNKTKARFDDMSEPWWEFYEAIREHVKEP